MVPDSDLVGQSVTLTAFREEHAERYAAWLADPYIQRMAGEEAETPEQVIERHRAWTASPTFLEYIVTERQGGTPIGDISLDFAHGDPRIGIMIADPAYRGRGHAAEAFRLVASVARRMGARRIIAEIYDWNDRSMRFHERMGFHRVRHDDALHEWIYEANIDAPPLPPSAQGQSSGGLTG